MKSLKTLGWVVLGFMLLPLYIAVYIWATYRKCPFPDCGDVNE